MLIGEKKHGIFYGKSLCRAGVRHKHDAYHFWNRGLFCLKEESWKYASDSIFQLTKVAEMEGLILALEPLTKYESNLVIDSKGLKKMLEEIQSASLKGMIDTVSCIWQVKHLMSTIPSFPN